MIFASDSTRTRQIPDFAGKTWNHLKITRTKAEIQFVLWEIWCSCIDGQCVGLLASNLRRSKNTRSLLQSVIEAGTIPGVWHTFGEPYFLTYKRTIKQTTTCLPFYIALHPPYYLTNFLPGTLWFHNPTTVYYTVLRKFVIHHLKLFLCSFKKFFPSVPFTSPQGLCYCKGMCDRRGQNWLCNRTVHQQGSV